MLEEMNIEDFDHIYKLMVENFPKHELRDYNEQKDMLKNEKFHIYIEKDTYLNNIKGFISIWNIENFVFVDHFVVSSKYRNEGLGGKILHEVKEKLNCEIFLEVDLPETEIAKRRIAFYERNGFFLYPYKYKLPALNEGSAPVTLNIMSTDEKLTEEKFIGLKKELFKLVYNIKDELE